MKVVRTIAALRAELEPHRAGSIGFVPTMGALHDGHLSLVRAARADSDFVVMSIFVNPTQFTEAADLAAYPRDEERDLALAAQAGVDLVFAPSPDELYPAGFATTVSVSGPLTETLEGAHRGPGHFNGVATVVAKLLIATTPDAVYFGAKDAQQVLVVRRMVRDLGLPVRIVACPTARDPDGLALSSRNVHLSPDERERAGAIPRALRAVTDAAASGQRDARTLHTLATEELATAGLATEYIAFVDPESLTPVDEVTEPTLVAIAARAGATRLIDNTTITPGGRA